MNSKGNLTPNNKFGDNASESSRITKNSLLGLDPLEEDIDLSVESKKVSDNSNISTFTDIAARIGKDLRSTGYKNCELDWLELETKVREMLSEQLRSVYR